MNFLKKIFGFKEEKEPLEISNTSLEGTFCMIEDNYLMIEFVPEENLTFIKKETERIDEFSKAHFNGFGFSEITPIGQKTINTLDKQYDIESVISVIQESGMKKIEKFSMLDVGILEGEEAPLGFGENNYAIMCNEKDGILEDIWFEGKAENEEEFQQIINTIYTLGKVFDLVLVNWFNSSYCTIKDRVALDSYVRENL